MTNKSKRTIGRLSEGEARIRAIVDTVVDGIVTISEQGIIETFNPAATRIFGYSEQEVIGQNVKILMPEPYHSEHDGYLNNYVTTGQAKIIGIGREVVGRHKDGSTFPMELAVSEMWLGKVRMFTGIVRDITERKEIDRMKTEFISTVSHELRTPLTSIRGSLGLVLGGAAGKISDEISGLLHIAANNSERLVRLINDILDVEKIESGKMQFDIRPHMLTPLVEQAIESNQAYAEQFKVRFELTEALEDVEVAVDSDRLLQVLTNLLSNAAKFSPEREKIEIAVSRQDGSVRVAVIDHGSGIPEEFRRQIFHKFAQADSSDTRQKGGTGLGLSISRAIIEKHGGHIAYTTEPGKGSCFYFELPACSSELATVRESITSLSRGSRILVCEDDEDVAKLLAMMLEQEGYACDIAYSAEQAKKLLFAKQYAAMTLDLMLPGQDGISLIRELRANTQTKTLPIVVVSAKAEQGKLELNGGAMGIIDWLEKPIDQQRLLDIVERAIRQHNGNTQNILHVEDDLDVVKVVTALLEPLAHVHHVRTLREAKHRLKREHFDLVILDIGLPDGTGLDLLSALNAIVPPVPVLVFSALEIDKTVTKDVSAVLIKSRTSNQELIDTINSLIRN